MRRLNVILVILIIAIFNSLLILPNTWRKARIVGTTFYPDYTKDEIFELIDERVKENANVLIIWSYISDEGYKISDEDIEYLKMVSDYTKNRYPDVKLLLYIAPIERQSYEVDMDQDGEVDPDKESLYTEHPEWAQISMSGKKAVFYGKIAFWLEETSEDMWICPLKEDYRNYWLKNVLEVEKTGIDGIWWDVPFFVHYFGDSWDGEWTCFSKECENGFKNYSSCELPQKEDWESSCWRRFIDFRYTAMGGFVKLIKDSLRKVNSNFVVVNEIWDENGVFSPQTGFSSYHSKESNYNDFIAHEYEPAYSADYDVFSWYLYISQLLTFRGIDGERPTWVLSYSHSKEHAKMRASATILTSSNFYETDDQMMSGTVGLDFRKSVFSWIKSNESYLYPEIEVPLVDVGVYFSQKSIDYYGLYDFRHDEDLKGIEMMLTKAGIPFEVLTREKLSYKLENKFKLIIVPSVYSISDYEAEKIIEFVENGGTVLVDYNSGKRNENGGLRNSSAFSRVCDMGSEFSIKKYGNGTCIYMREPVGSLFYRNTVDVEKNISKASSWKDIFEFFISKVSPYTSGYVKKLEGENIFIYPVLGFEEISGKNTMILSIRVINLKGIDYNDYEPEAQDIEMEVNLPLTLKLMKNELHYSEIFENDKKLLVNNNKNFKIKLKIKRFLIIKAVLNPFSF